MTKRRGQHSKWQMIKRMNPWRRSQLTEGYTQQQGRDQQDGAGDHSPCMVPMAVAPVGPITVVTKATLHLGSGVAVASLVAESLVCARLHHGVWKKSVTEKDTRCRQTFRVKLLWSDWGLLLGTRYAMWTRWTPSHSFFHAHTHTHMST